MIFKEFLRWESRCFMRSIQSFDENWYFSYSDIDESKEMWFDHSAWQRVTLPHDFTVGKEFEKQAPTGGRGGFTKSGVDFYRKYFTVTEEMLERNVEVQFDGIFMNSKIWING